MKITVRFYDGREPQTLDAATASEALKQVKDDQAFIAMPLGGGIEVMRYLPDSDGFVFSTGYRLAQAVEDLFTREAD